MFLSAVDRETGSLLHLPRSGGIMDQPYREMQVFSYMQGLFVEAINDHIKKLKGKR